VRILPGNVRKVKISSNKDLLITWKYVVGKGSEVVDFVTVRRSVTAHNKPFSAAR
jgi:hypothetical protein